MAGSKFVGKAGIGDSRRHFERAILGKMPEVVGDFDPIIHSRRKMKGYYVENIAIKSFPGFYITGNLYSPANPSERNPAILSPHGHAANKRLTEDVQKRCAGVCPDGRYRLRLRYGGLCGIYANDTQDAYRGTLADLE